MASATLQLALYFAPGSTVEVHPRSHWSNPTGPPAGAPAGAATTSAVVGPTGSTTFSGLVDDGTVYFTYQAGTGVGPNFMARDADPSSSTGTATASVTPGTETLIPLGAGATYVGPWIDVGADGGQVEWTARGDQALSLQVQESSTGAENAAGGTSITAARASEVVGALNVASVGPIVTLRRYVRVRVVNTSGVAMTTLEVARVVI